MTLDEDSRELSRSAFFATKRTWATPPDLTSPILLPRQNQETVLTLAKEIRGIIGSSARQRTVTGVERRRTTSYNSTDPSAPIVRLKHGKPISPCTGTTGRAGSNSVTGPTSTPTPTATESAISSSRASEPTGRQVAARRGRRRHF